MDDNKIIALFWERSETALTEFEKSHKRLCVAMATEITGNPHDAEECFSDTRIQLSDRVCGWKIDD